MCVALLMVQATAYAQSPNSNGNSKDIDLGHRTVKVQESEGDYSYLVTSSEPLTDKEFAALNKYYDTKFQEKYKKLHEKNEKAVYASFLSPFRATGVVYCSNATFQGEQNVSSPNPTAPVRANLWHRMVANRYKGYVGPACYDKMDSNTQASGGVTDLRTPRELRLGAKFCAEGYGITTGYISVPPGASTGATPNCVATDNATTLNYYLTIGLTISGSSSSMVGWIGGANQASSATATLNNGSVLTPHGFIDK